jgi:4-diphosphocytidyl-2-C-methyl-D-erythritol kinase
VPGEEPRENAPVSGPAVRLVEKAPAKVNLTLHVIGRRPDGWHALESLVAFAGAADTLELLPGEASGLDVDGPRAGAAGPMDANLVLRAASALARRRPGLLGGRFHLTKRLPVAAGLGGGSSDAAAALRLLARLNGIPADDPDLHDAASEVGSDVPVCLAARARMMRGRGEDLGPLLALPPVFAVLVNPGVPVETTAVFKALGLSPGEDLGYGRHPDVAAAPGREALMPLLRKARNDLEDPAAVVAPVIGHVLAVIAAARGCRLARMSGSGATCFGLFDDCRAAQRAARGILAAHPEWWVKPTLLR